MGFEPTKVCKNCQKGGARILALDGICWHIWIRPGIDVALLQQNCLQAAHRWEGAHERWPKSAGQILIQLGDWMIVICSGNLRRQRKSTIIYIYIYKYRFLEKNMFYAFNIYICICACMCIYISIHIEIVVHYVSIFLGLSMRWFPIFCWPERMMPTSVIQCYIL